jgi:hypothetical protein
MNEQVKMALTPPPKLELQIVVTVGVRGSDGEFRPCGKILPRAVSEIHFTQDGMDQKLIRTKDGFWEQEIEV